MQTGCHQARVAQQAGTQRNQKSTCMSGSPQARTAPTRAESALGALGLAGRHDGNALAPRRLGVRGLLGGHGRPLTVLQRRDDRAGLLDYGWARQVAARAHSPVRQIRIPKHGIHPLSRPAGRAATAGRRLQGSGGRSRPACWPAAGAQHSPRRQAAAPEPKCGPGRSRSRPCYTWRSSHQTLHRPGKGRARPRAIITENQARSAHRKAASVLKSRPSGWRRLRSYVARQSNGCGTAGVPYLAALRSQRSLITTAGSAASLRPASAASRRLPTLEPPQRGPAI